MFLKIAKIWREKKEKRKRGLELSYMYPTASDRRCAALRFCLLLRPFTSATLSSHNWLFSKLRKRSEQTPNHHRITCSVTERSRVPSAGNKGDSFTASSFDSFVLPSFLPSFLLPLRVSVSVLALYFCVRVMKTTSPAMTALEWQRARPLEWLHEKGTAQFQQQTQSFCDSGGGGNGGSTLSFYPGDENSMGLGEVVNQYNMMDLCVGLEYWSQLGEIEVPSLRFGGGIAAAAASSEYQVTCGSISRTASCPSAAVEAATDGMLEQAAENIGAPVGKDSFRKRKLERVQSTKVTCSVFLHLYIALLLKVEEEQKWSILIRQKGRL